MSNNKNPFDLLQVDCPAAENEEQSECPHHIETEDSNLVSVHSQETHNMEGFHLSASAPVFLPRPVAIQEDSSMCFITQKQKILNRCVCG